MKVYVTRVSGEITNTVWDDAKELLEYLSSIGNLGVGRTLVVSAEEMTKEEFDSLEKDEDEDIDS